MLFGMFDDIKKNNFGKVEIRIYFREISIIEFYNDRFGKSLKKIDNLISRFNKKINRYNITRDIDIDDDQKTASFVQLKNDRNTLKNKEFDLTCVSNIVYAVGKQIEQKYQ